MNRKPYFHLRDENDVLREIGAYQLPKIIHREALNNGITDQFTRIRLECWEKDPRKRPTMQEILLKLDADHIPL
jgi:hypothetical protein